MSVLPSCLRRALLPGALLLATPVALAQQLMMKQAQGSTTHCELDVYTAYDRALKRGWTFKCHNATFVPEHAYRAISCQGKSPPIVGSNGMDVHGYFFRSSAGQAPALKNGWQVDSWEVSGGNWEKWPPGEARVDLHTRITAPNTSFRRRVTRLKVTKAGGDCSRVYDEAF